MSPTRPLRPCSGRGGRCPNLVPSGRCPACSRQREQERGSAASRGYGAAWRRIRGAGPLCVTCQVEQGIVTPATDVDHIDGDSRNNALHNLRPLCHRCHSRRTLRDQVPRW